MSDPTLEVAGFTPYARVPLWLLRYGAALGLTSTDVAVYTALMSFADNYTKTAWPGLEAISERALCSVDTVRRSLRRLQDAKAVTVEHRTGKVSNYRLAYAPAEAGLEASHFAHPDPSQNAGTPSQNRGEYPSQDAVRTKPIELTQELQAASSAQTAADAMAADVWANRWADMTRTIYTQAVRRHWLPQVLAFMAAGGVPSDELLSRAAAAGIAHPGGWQFIKGSAGLQRPVELLTPELCATRGHGPRADVGDIEICAWCRAELEKEKET